MGEFHKDTQAAMHQRQEEAARDAHEKNNIAEGVFTHELHGEEQKSDDSELDVGKAVIGSPSSKFSSVDDLRPADAHDANAAILTKVETAEPHFLSEPNLAEASSSNIEDVAASVPWRPKNFTGTLSLRMGDGATLANQNLAMPNEVAAELTKTVEQDVSTERGGFQAPASDQAQRGKSTPFDHGSIGRAPFSKLKAAVLASALIAVFAGGAIADFVARGSSVATLNAEKQLHGLDEISARLKLEEERLLALEAESEKKAEELRRLTDEVAARIKDADQKRADEKRLAEEFSATQQVEFLRDIEAANVGGAETGVAVVLPDPSSTNTEGDRVQDPAKPEATASPVNPMSEIKSAKTWSKQKRAPRSAKQKPPVQQNPD